MAMMAGDAVKVAVRVRPINKRELELGTETIVEMEGDQTTLRSTPNIRKPPKTFAFDHCFWSCSSASSSSGAEAKFADQQTVFAAIGTDVLMNAFHGYNACMLAYGQTGSGKSYTMMGGGGEGEEGVIPRLCRQLFQRIQKEETDTLMFKVEVSYMEIYNERVRDLLDVEGDKECLRVREHNIFGPYVDGLCSLAVSNYEQMAALMEEGNQSRTVAATNMNAESSRSHAVFTIRLTQTIVDKGTTGEKVAKISLVDLAGSERASKSGAVGKRLMEGANINKSLTTLGMVIGALAQRSTQNSKTRAKFVPYRDSVLTWLLKDNLGGNSRTVMIVTISPSADSYEETLSTLRYADRAKQIRNHAVINEDPNAKIIRELRAEVDALRAQLDSQNQAADLRERLAESEKLIGSMTTTWEERLRETQRIHLERQRALQSMGILIGKEGITVQRGKYYFVNLNADPSLNEMLVYHVADGHLIGSDAKSDIRLRGLGVNPKHMRVEVDGNMLYATPVGNAVVCVNGRPIASRTLLRNGFRLLIGNDHFFRVNCPREQTTLDGDAARMQTTLDGDAARMQTTLGDYAAPSMDGGEYAAALGEVMRLERVGHDDPIASAVEYMQRKEMMEHQLDKEEALQRQKILYEKHINQLRSAISPFTDAGSTALSPPRSLVGSCSLASPFPNPQSDVQAKFSQDESFRDSLTLLREAIGEANRLTRDANLIAAELAVETEYSVTLQIPAANLTPAKIKQGGFVSEPAILVRRKGKPSQIWSWDKLSAKLVDMRELYDDWQSAETEGGRASIVKSSDPFFESQHNHNLIGVANVFLEVLFHDVRLDYRVPIISQQGEIAGRLHVEVFRVDGEGEEGDDVFDKDTIRVCVRIRAATNLPPALANFVFCQYRFFGESTMEVVTPRMDGADGEMSGTRVVFDHERVYDVEGGEEFLEHCHDDALSIEIWGHRTCFDNDFAVECEAVSKAKSIQEKWADVTCRLQLWVEVEELTEEGAYTPVEVQQGGEVITGGVYMLKQGQQRRVVCTVTQIGGQSESLPLVARHVSSVAVGGVCARDRTIQKPLDSYQEVDLDLVKEEWGTALQTRREYLDEQIQRLMRRPDKCEADVEREQSLITQWVALTEERNAVYLPAADSTIPGAQNTWTPPPGVERHIPVVFLDAAIDHMHTSMTSSSTSDSVPTAGNNATLPKENLGTMFSLPILGRDAQICRATASWDCSIHEHESLLRLTPSNERVYVIVRVAIRISHPTDMEVILRKRIAVHLRKKASMGARLLRRLVGTDSLTGSGVHFDIVGHVPSSATEEFASLALVAARTGDEGEMEDGQSYMERYQKGISAVESILCLDRLRQEVAIKELLTSAVEGGGEGRTRRSGSTIDHYDAFYGALKRAASLPTVHQDSASSPKGQGVSRRFSDRRQTPPVLPRPNCLSIRQHLIVRLSHAVESAGSPSRSRMNTSLRNVSVGRQLCVLDEDIKAELAEDPSLLTARSTDCLNNRAAPRRPASTSDCGEDMVNGNGKTMISSTYSDYGAHLIVNNSLVTSVGGTTTMESSAHNDSTTSSGVDGLSLPSWLRVGCRVHVCQSIDRPVTPAVVRYIGATEFRAGICVGVQCAQPIGDCDGAVDGVTYFNCKAKHGLFVHHREIAPY